MFRNSLLTVVAALIVAGISSAAGAQTTGKGVDGDWRGTLKVPGADLRLAVHFHTKDGAVKGTMDSLDQGAMDLVMDKVAFSGDKLEFGLTDLGASYTGRLSANEETISGTFTQGGASFPLTFKRSTGAEPKPKRPQMPKKPYPYKEEQVTYENKSAGAKFAATLTIPSGKGPFPAVVMITGSGPEDRDETVFGHRPFLIVADYLTRRGIAVLRADDRGVGGSTGDLVKATSEDFASDTVVGIEFLKGRKEINHRKIGLIGHSEGGMIAPMVAVERPKDVAFIVLMAGTGVPGDEIILKQSELIAKAMGAPQSAIDQQMQSQERIFSVVKSEKDPAEAEKKLRALVKEEIAKTKASGQTVPDGAEKAAEGQIEQANSPWMRFFLTYDPRPTLAKVKVPVLALNGSKDLQVPVKQNLPEIAKALKSGGNKDFTTKELPGLNHLFQTATTGSPSEYVHIEETVSPTALKVMGDWIVKHTQPGR